MIRLFLVVFSLALCLSGLQAQQASPLSFTILQLNDVYEIAPLANGAEGGMARVAAYRKMLLARNPNTITVLAGDFLSPSLIGTLPYTDVRGVPSGSIAGRQMVDVMNVTGVDYVTFGNHEFDISMASLTHRLNESRFNWVCSNVFLQGMKPFTQTRNGITDTVRAYAIKELNFPGGARLRVGIIGAVLDFNRSKPVVYTDVDSSVKAAFNLIKPQCDVVIALTHLNLEQDKQLAAAVPGLHLIIGGHEHINSASQVGGVSIYKADANARSVYVHQITFTPGSGEVKVNSELVFMNAAIPFDPEVNLVVRHWTSYADSIMRAMGYDPGKRLMTARTPLDGREAIIRNGSTNFTSLITDAIFSCDSSVDMALFNSGSLRVDDQLEGAITQYDILRSLPYGGNLVVMKLKGDVLRKVLSIGSTINRNTGGYLQLSGATVGKSIRIRGRLLKDNKEYRILLPKFVAEGGETNLGFLKQYSFCTPNAFFNNQVKNDIRDVVMWWMRNIQLK